MKRRRHTPEQIVRKLREAERLLGEGQTIAEAAKQVEISRGDKPTTCCSFAKSCAAPPPRARTR